MKKPKSEKLEVYDLYGNPLCIMERDDFYKMIREEYAKTGKITKQVRVVRFLLMTSDGRIYVQKRSPSKKENPGRYDKTVGGHVKAHHSDNIGAFLECQEELAIPMHPLSDSDFEAVRKTNDLSVVGIMQFVEKISGLISIRQSADGSSFEQPVIAAFYIGYYNGPIRFKDGESTGVETFNLVELEALMKEKPDSFTEDLKFMIKRFRRYLVPLKDYRKSKVHAILG